jgi:hypothetical protein
MPSVVHNHSVADNIWVIGSKGVEKGTVIDIGIFIKSIETIIQYQVQKLTPGEGGVEHFLEDDSFATKAEAIIEYETRVQD